jgi:putative transposase
MLPKEYQKWGTVYSRVRRWRLSGRWQAIHDALRGYHRFAVGHDGLKRGQRGDDAGKKTKGRKRHIGVDTPDLVWAVVVHPAGIQYRVGARTVPLRLFAICPRLVKFFADGG